MLCVKSYLEEIVIKSSRDIVGYAGMFGSRNDIQLRCGSSATDELIFVIVSYLIKE